MSSPERVPIDVEVLRAMTAAHVATTSISEVARQVGVTTRGLSLFLKGSDPYSGNRQKLERWYVRKVAQQTESTDATTAAAALTVLVRAMPPSHQKDVAAEAVAWWAAKYDERSVPRPAWIEQLAVDLAKRGRTGGPPR